MHQRILFQRTIVNISLNPDSPIPPIEPSPIRHLVKDSQDKRAICGYVRNPGDTMQDSYVDPGSVACPECAEEANQD